MCLCVYKSPAGCPVSTWVSLTIKVTHHRSPAHSPTHSLFVRKLSPKVTQKTSSNPQFKSYRLIWQFYSRSQSTNLFVVLNCCWHIGKQKCLFVCFVRCWCFRLPVGWAASRLAGRPGDVQLNSGGSWARCRLCTARLRSGLTPSVRTGRYIGDTGSGGGGGSYGGIMWICLLRSFSLSGQYSCPDRQLQTGKLSIGGQSYFYWEDTVGNGQIWSKGNRCNLNKVFPPFSMKWMPFYFEN